MQDVSSFLVAAIALTGSPGPATLGLAAAGAAYGVRRSWVLLAGILAGVLIVMLMTATGIIGLVLAQPGLGPAVTALAAGYMLYLAYRIATAPLPGGPSADDRPPGLATGLFLGFGNPKAYAAMAALNSGFVLVRDDLVADVAAKAVILAVVIAAGGWLWLLAGSVLTRWLRDPIMGRAINVGFAVLLVVSIALAFLV